MSTLQERLQRVQAAIEAIETGAQEVTYENRSVTKADLKTLYEQEKYLEQRVARQSRGGGIRTRGGVPL
jgi:hypothetical protein